MNGDSRTKPVPPCDPQKLAEHNANIERDDMGQHSLKNVLTEALNWLKHDNAHMAGVTVGNHLMDFDHPVQIRLYYIHDMLDDGNAPEARAAIEKWLGEL